MILNTSRFGPTEIDDDRVVTFPNGLLGFSEYTRYAILRPDGESVFYWLQSVEAPELAFVVTDPAVFIEDYRVPLRVEQQEALGIEDIHDAQVLVVVNKRGREVTANLQGPLVIHVDRCVGEQVIVADKKWHTRVELLRLDRVESASA